MFPRTATIRSHKSRAGKPSNLNPASFRVLMNCEKLMFVSYTSNLLEQTYDFQKNAQCSSRSGFWVLKISCKIGVLKQSQSALFCSITHITKLLKIHMCDECKISNELIVCHKLWSILVIDRANLFTNQRISSLPIRAKYKHFRTIWEHNFDNSPTDLNSSSLKWWSSMHGVDTLWSCWVSRLVWYLTISLHTFLCMTFPIIRPRRSTIFRVW